jgi:pilus assembly protein CpaF
MEGDQIQVHDLFAYEQRGIDNGGHAVGSFITTGIRPRSADRIESRGIGLAAELFAPREVPAE